MPRLAWTRIQPASVWISRANASLDTVRHRLHGSEVGAGAEDDELVPRRHDPPRPRTARPRAGGSDLDQDGVADGVTMGVVDPLEVVEVDEHDADPFG